MKSICTIAAVCVAAFALGCESDQKAESASPGVVSDTACCSEAADCCASSCSDKSEVSPGAVSECSASSDCASKCPATGK